MGECSNCDHPTQMHRERGCEWHAGLETACPCLCEWEPLSNRFLGEVRVARDPHTPCAQCPHNMDSHPAGEGGTTACFFCQCPRFIGGAASVREGGARDAQVGGSHYKEYKIQPWDIWQEYGLDAFRGAILKYLLRDKGNKVEDLKKARHTLDRLIEIEEGK